MTNSDKPVSKELTAQESAAVLQRILKSVEKDERQRWVEIACAVVLSLATTASAWCAYQSTLWDGAETFRLAAANQAARSASQAKLAALQPKVFDASMFIEYIQAKNQANERQEHFLFNRFRPEMKAAVEAWLKTDPFNDPTAPLGPFKMAEYVQLELQEAERQDDLFAQKHAAAQQANNTADSYLLLTVMFASVLFFGGIGGSFQSRPLRQSVFAIALVLFTITMIALATMPLCKE